MTPGRIIACLTVSLALVATSALGDDPAPIRVLVFSKAGWFRHPEIPRTNGWLVRLGQERGFVVDVTETPGDLSADRLAGYRVLVLNNANELGQVLDERQRKAVADWYRKGNGIVGLHAALVHQKGWPWLNQLAGADFDSDSDFAKARLVIDPAALDDPAVKGFGPELSYSADWHNHDRSVTGLPGFRVLMRVDEKSYTPVRPYFQQRGGKPMGADHPSAWTHEGEGGRFFYTELGHDLRSLDTTFGRQHVAEAIRWASSTPR
jgi:type 1 glutamine amidotransferase